MRSDQQMLDLIVNTAQSDERIRVVIMNGSRANPNAPRDLFQDFDIVYFVTDVIPFRYNEEWINRFGELMIMQMPEDMLDASPGNDGGFTYLMQFTDGNRLDLGICPLTELDQRCRDSLSLLLLDKDGRIDTLPPPSEEDYVPKPPSAKAFSDCCNEFWWVCPYVAKGLWRKEIVYAKYMLDHIVQSELMKMLNWYIGVKTGFSQNPGKMGRFFKRYLETDVWNMLEKTYADARYDKTWEALFATCRLFRKTALTVAENFVFQYPHRDDERVSAHLEHVQNLPGNAREMY